MVLLFWSWFAALNSVSESSLSVYNATCFLFLKKPCWWSVALFRTDLWLLTNYCLEIKAGGGKQVHALNFLFCPVPSMIAYLSTLIDDRNVINTRFLWQQLPQIPGALCRDYFFFNMELWSYTDISSKNCLFFFFPKAKFVLALQKFLIAEQLLFIY